MYWLRRVAAEVRDILHWLNHNPPGGPPLRWRKPQRVFVDSMSDLFHEQLEVYDIAEVWARMAATEHITYQVLTKRAARLPEILNDRAFRDEVDRRIAAREDVPALCRAVRRMEKALRQLCDCGKCCPCEARAAALSELPWPRPGEGRKDRA